MTALHQENPTMTPAPRHHRREFLGTASLAAGAAAALPTLLAPAVHAAGSDRLKVGLVGCGGRGSGAASQALSTSGDVALTAVGDVFPDRMDQCLRSLQAMEPIAAKVDVPVERRFTGFDAYKQVIDSGVDVVLLTTPPHFRPMHIEAAVAAGKHIFAEKPCAVDALGVHRVLAACEQAKAKGLAVVSGLTLRYMDSFREAIKRVHDGAVGEVRTILANDYRNATWSLQRKPDWTDMEWQMRNWPHFTWLSGDFNVEQHVHNLDVCAWAMGDRYPVKAIGLGGQQVRKGPGNIFDHHSVVYEYEDGTRLVSNCRQITGCKKDIGVDVLGSTGTLRLSEQKGGMRITGAKPWEFEGAPTNGYQVEHDELFASIRAGKPINNGEGLAKSTLLAIMGRWATYTGQEITWDMIWNSKQDLTPASYEFGPLPMPPVATPGVTKFA
jgi:predicted dehydrogenase